MRICVTHTYMMMILLLFLQKQIFSFYCSYRNKIYISFYCSYRNNFFYCSYRNKIYCSYRNKFFSHIRNTYLSLRNPTSASRRWSSISARAPCAGRLNRKRLSPVSSPSIERKKSPEQKETEIGNSFSLL